MTDPVIRIADLTTTAWRVVARQPVSTMRWTYFVPPYDLRDPATRRRVQTVTRRDPDAYVLLARIRPA
jgi:hypothetical protein